MDKYMYLCDGEFKETLGNAQMETDTHFDLKGNMLHFFGVVINLDDVCKHRLNDNKDDDNYNVAIILRGGMNILFGKLTYKEAFELNSVFTNHTLSKIEATRKQLKYIKDLCKKTGENYDEWLSECNGNPSMLNADNFITKLIVLGIELEANNGGI